MLCHCLITAEDIYLGRFGLVGKALRKGGGVKPRLYGNLVHFHYGAVNFGGFCGYGDTLHQCVQHGNLLAVRSVKRNGKFCIDVHILAGVV